jgi:hypothetical protein
MPSTVMPVAERPIADIPSRANKSNIWYDQDGTLREHDIELPVDAKTHRINGRLYACVQPGCPTAEWAIEPQTQRKTLFCPLDRSDLSLVPLDPSQDDPMAGARHQQQARLLRIAAAKRAAAAEKIRNSVAVQGALQAKRGLPEKLAEAAREGRGHLPSLAATAVIEVGVIYSVDLLGALEGAAIGAAVAVGGAVAGYALAVYTEKIRLKLRKEGFEGRAAKKARERGLWAGRAAISTGTLLTVTGTVEGLVGLDVTSVPQWAVLSLLGIGLAWWTNQAHWNRLWAERRRLRQLALDNARRAAEEAARRAEEEAARALRDAQVREELAELGELDENNPLHQGQRMKIEWDKIKDLPTAATGFPRIGQTWIEPEHTREVSVPDPVTGKKVRIGWEYYGRCEPGALVSVGGITPIQMAKEWLVSVLFDGKFNSAAISVMDQPGDTRNTFMVMITERARLGEAVVWRADKAVRIEPDGSRYGYFGRSLLGVDVDELLYKPGQAFGGLVQGTTGGGKGGHAMRHILNLLFARMLPIVHDPKRLVDYADFIGVFPIGFTKRHRRIITESLAAERERREKTMAAAPKENRYGQKVYGESKWMTRDPDTGEIGVYGEPIEWLLDEFHDDAMDTAWLAHYVNHKRLQRAAGIGSTELTQGGGLSDLGDSVLRDLSNQTSLTQYRGGEMQSRLGGGRNQQYSTADLPALAGMCLRQAPGAPKEPMRAAYITRDPAAEDTVYTTLWGKKRTPVLQIEDQDDRP